MNDTQYEYLTSLQYRVQNLKHRLEAFESGAIYTKMADDYKSLLHTEESRIKKLEDELLRADSRLSRSCDMWQEVLDDICAGYRDGYNLYKRMVKYRTAHLLFLHDMKVPHNNNLAERLLRAYKRKQHQVMSFRSDESIDYLCQCMSMLLSLRRDSEESLFDSVSKIFDRQKADRAT